MVSQFSPRFTAILQALLVTFLWSTSWVFIKLGLNSDMPPLTFAGLRYALAFGVLLAVVVSRPIVRAQVRRLSHADWRRLLVLGVLFYTITQGAQFLSLAVLPSATVNLLLSFGGLLVALLSIVLLHEQPTSLQWGGLALYIVGALVYFLPAAFSADQWWGILAAAVCVMAYSGATLLGRSVNRHGALHPLVVTTVSMGIGSLLLLLTGIATRGLPALTLPQWGIIAWLALINTAFAFTLWNTALRTLGAMEASIINNLMLIEIPVLAWLFLGETVTIKQGIALAIAGGGILLVQLRHINLSRSIASISRTSS
jgi:drug/metabolite transporter (DMT)-like permease